MIDLIIVFILILCPLMTVYAGKRYSYSLWLSPLFFVSIQLFIGATVKGILYLYSSNFRSSLSYGDSNYLIDAALFVFLFTALLIVGYGLGVNKNLRTNRVTAAFNNHKLDKKTIWQVLIFGVLIFVVTSVVLSQVKDNFTGLGQLFSAEGLARLQRGKIQRIDGVLTHGESFRAITIFYSIIFFMFCVMITQLNIKTQTNKRLLAYSCFVIFILIIFEILIRGKRNLMLEMMIVFGIGRFGLYVVGNLQIRKFFVPAAMVMFFLFVFSFITTFRGIAEEEHYGTQVNILEPIVDTVLLKPYFMDINKVSLIMAEAGNYDYKYGLSLVNWIIGFVPRALWEDKPALSLGLFVKSDIFGLDGTIGGIPPTLPGEFFINFGWLGVLVALVFGFGLRKLEQYLLTPSRIANYGTHWIYIYLLPTIAFSSLQTAVGLFAVKGLTAALLVLPILFILSRSTRIKGYA